MMNCHCSTFYSKQIPQLAQRYQHPWTCHMLVQFSAPRIQPSVSGYLYFLSVLCFSASNLFSSTNNPLRFLTAWTYPSATLARSAFSPRSSSSSSVVGTQNGSWSNISYLNCGTRGGCTSGDKQTRLIDSSDLPAENKLWARSS